jgi:predicted enzyme related to lactoylglutathione lyase
MLTRNQRPTSHRLLHRVTPLLLMAVLLCSCTQPGEESPQPSGELNSMAEDKHVHHGIDYIEFAVTDMDLSKRFYQTAFDWKFNDYGPDYAGIQKPGGEAGGFRLEAEVSAGSPLVVLYSSDLDMTLTRVREAGGRILKEPFDFPGGRRFEFEDPSGNQLAVWSDK